MNKNQNVCLKAPHTAYRTYEGILNYTMISKPNVCNPHNCTMGSQFTIKVQQGVTYKTSSYLRTNAVDRSLLVSDLLAIVSGVFKERSFFLFDINDRTKMQNETSRDDRSSLQSNVIPL